MRRIVIIGAGQQGRNCKVLAELNGYRVAYFIDDHVKGDIEGVPVKNEIERCADYDKFMYIIGIGDTAARRRYIDEIERLKLDCVTLIAPSALIGKGAEIGEGTYICSNAVVYGSAKVGNHSIINTKALLATDAVVGNNCNICFGSNLCGDVHVGDESVIGYNATVASGYNVGKRATVEANSVVYRDVEDGEYVNGIVR